MSAVTHYIGLLADLLDNAQAREMLDMGARFIYSEPGVYTFNLIPSVVAVLLGIIVLWPLLGSIPALFKSGSTGYGPPEYSGYGLPDTSYGAPPEFRSFQEYEDVADVVRYSEDSSAPGAGEQNSVQNSVQDFGSKLGSNSLVSQLGTGARMLH